MGKLIDLNALTKYDQLIKGSLGKLAGTYATLAALQTAYPTGATGNFLVEADGHWYYWDGAWTDGGEYLSDAVKNDGNQLKDHLGNNIYPKLFKRLNFINQSFNVSGGYYGSQGGVVSNSGSTYNTDYIEVEGSKTLVWSSLVDMQICVYDSNKTFISRITENSKQYATLSSTAKFIRVSLYSGDLNNLMLTYMELYQAFVLYEGYVDGKNVLDNSLLKKSFKYGELESLIGTPVYLSYLDKTNYEYVDVGDGYLNAYGEYVESSGYHTVYFVVKEDEITLWYNLVTGGSYFSICVANGIFGTRNTQYGSRYRISDNNMPTQADPLVLKRGQIVGLTYDSDVSNFNLGVSGVIGNYIIDKKFKLYVPKSINVLKSGYDYYISMNGYLFNFIKYDLNNINLHSYDIPNVSKNGNIIENGQMFAAVKEDGESDFMGGRDHGDDVMISMSIFADGLPITSSETSCNRVDIYLTSYLQRVSTKENVFKKFIHIVFENNTMKTEVGLVCLVNNFNLSVAYVGMWGQRKSFVSDVFLNCAEFDIQTAPTDTINANIERVSYVLNSPDSLINIMNTNHENAKITHYNYVDDQRFKTYFMLKETATINSGYYMESKTIYNFD